MHFKGPYLHLEGYALPVDKGSVEGLIVVGLGCGNIVLKSAGNGSEHIVYHSENVIAIVNRIDNYSDGIDVVNLVKGLLLKIHFPIDSVNGFDPPVNVEVFEF